LASMYPLAKLAHQFSTEIDVEKQSYIKATFPALGKLFVDVGALKLDKALNVACSEIMHSYVDRVFFFIAGFACGDISSLNNNAKDFTHCIVDGNGRTGGTWKGLIGYAQTHQPPNIILENVLKLKGSNLQQCLDDLQAVGYNAIALPLSPHKCVQVPQTRARIYIVATKLLTMTELTDLEHVIAKFVADDVPPIPVDCFLMREGDEVIEDSLQMHLRHKMSKRKNPSAEAKVHFFNH
jgi:site-specific DNA-cytosine methylase